MAKDAVHAMLGHLMDAFLPNTVPLATDSERRRKLYPADLDLIKALDASDRSNLGHALETAVLNELERRGAEVGYVKTGDGLEVDILARRPGAREELIQVCADLSSPETRARTARPDRGGEGPSARDAAAVGARSRRVRTGQHARDRGTARLRVTPCGTGPRLNCGHLVRYAAERHQHGLAGGAAWRARARGQEVA